MQANDQPYIGRIKKVTISSNKKTNAPIVNATLSQGSVVELDDGSVEDQTQIYYLKFFDEIAPLAQKRVKVGVELEVYGDYKMSEREDKEGKIRHSEEINVKRFKVSNDENMEN